MGHDDLYDIARSAKEDRGVGITMIVVAVLLAIATMLAHRTHIKEVLVQTRANDQWMNYQAKITHANMYETNSDLAALLKGEAPANDFKERSEAEKKEAEVIRKVAVNLENQVDVMSRRGDRQNLSEIFFELAIVLCSITLLTSQKMFWRISFAGTLIGLLVLASSLLIG
jgi:hypothetical protein